MQEPLRRSLTGKKLVPTKVPSCLSRVAISTSDFAFLNFGLYSSPREAFGRGLAEIESLLTPDVVKLQYNWIGLSAVNARVLFEVVEYFCAYHFTSTLGVLCGLAQIHWLVRLIVCLRLGACAPFTDRDTNPLGLVTPMEFGFRQDPTTRSTRLHALGKHK